MINWILTKVGGPFLVYIAFALGATSITSIAMTKFYRTKAKAAVYECNERIEKGAREAQEEVVKTLEEAYLKLELENKMRREQELKAIEKDKAVIARITQQKLNLERKLQDVLKDKDTRDWADREFPSGLCESTPHCDQT